MEATMRDEILRLLSGEKINSKPSFSGLIHITGDGLQSEGLSFNDIHADPQKMAKAAVSTFKLTGLPSVTLPLDLCAPAEALGAELKYYPEDEMRFPQVGKVKFESTTEITRANTEFTEILDQGRLRTICEAITLVKKEIGKEAVVSGLIPGPFTLLLYACKPKNVFIEIKKNPDAVAQALLLLSSFLAQIGGEYIKAGADFITVHEMGGSPGFIGPNPFEQQVMPSLQNLLRSFRVPTVLSVCGRTNPAMHLLAQCGASAISVDQMTDIVEARKILGDALLFGNIDPVGVLYQGEPADVVDAAFRAKEAGVDAIWPGCDLVPQTPIENMRRLFDPKKE
jgi:[methyl-Co(III) methanol-specific corrinoid protein]:coenzyme M methyltransferase